MNNNDGLNYRSFGIQLQDVDKASEHLRELSEMTREAQSTVFSLIHRFGYDQVDGSTFVKLRARRFAEHVLQFKHITISRNVTVPGDQKLKEEDIFSLTNLVNENQKWANEVLLRATFPRKAFPMICDGKPNITNVLLKLAVRQRAMWFVYLVLPLRIFAHTS
jgi:hypothetical protein